MAVVTALGAAWSASADTVLWVHGATAGDIPLADVMKRVPPGYTLREVEYSAGLWPWTGLTTKSGAQSIAEGVVALDRELRQTAGQGQTLVIGESLGSMVVDQELRELAARNDGPDPATVRFEVIADPARPGGLLSYLPIGMYEPLTGTTTQAVPETRYDVSVIKLQYDGMASWPDRPWHLLSVANAVAGGVVYHGTDHYGIAAQAIMNGQIPPEDITSVVNARGGVTTTYTVQQKPALPHLLEPIFPQPVEQIDKVLTPLINRGYSALTADAGPHLGSGYVLLGKDDQPLFRGSPCPKTSEATPPRLPVRALAQSPAAATAMRHPGGPPRSGVRAASATRPQAGATVKR